MEISIDTVDDSDRVGYSGRKIAFTVWASPDKCAGIDLTARATVAVRCR